MTYDTTDDNGTLHDYLTGDELRPATRAELLASAAAAKRDGGAGVIKVNGRACYVVGDVR